MRILAAALLAAGAVGAGLVVSSSGASAQNYGPSAPYATVPADEIIVTAPRYRNDHNRLNVPIENVSLSQPVRTDDLDLRSWQGAHELRRRVHIAADQVCRQLIDAYPVGVDSDATCYRNAVAEAMPQADAAIQSARSYPPGYGGY